MIMKMIHAKIFEQFACRSFLTNRQQTSEQQRRAVSVFGQQKLDNEENNAVFHCSGKTPDDSERLTKYIKALVIPSTQILIILLLIPSGPHALLIYTPRKRLFISYSVAITFDKITED